MLSRNVARLALSGVLLASVSCTTSPAATVSPSQAVPGPVTTGALAEGSWEVTELRISDAMQVLETGERVTLDVHPGNLITGLTACSAFAGAFAMDGQTIKFADVTTAGACSDPAAAAVGSAFAAALAAARTVKRTQKGLSLVNDSGETVATLESGVEAVSAGVTALLTELTSLMSETESVLNETKSTIAATDETLADVDATVATTNQLLAGIQDSMASMGARIDQSEGRITSRLQNRFDKLASGVAGARSALDARLQAMREELAGVRDAIDTRLQDLAGKLEAQLSGLRDALEAKIDAVDGRLESVGAALDKRLTKLQDALDARLQTIESRLAAIEERLQGLPGGPDPAP